MLAPIGRKNIPEAERLDVAAIAHALAGKGLDAVAPDDLAAVEAAILERAAPGDTVLIMSNGDFGGLYDRLIARLARR